MNVILCHPQLLLWKAPNHGRKEVVTLQQPGQRLASIIKGRNSHRQLNRVQMASWNSSFRDTHRHKLPFKALLSNSILLWFSSIYSAADLILHYLLFFTLLKEISRQSSSTPVNIHMASYQKWYTACILRLMDITWLKWWVYSLTLLNSRLQVGLLHLHFCVWCLEA